MKKLIYVLLTAALFVSALVSAVTPRTFSAVVTISAPTQYVDGTSLPASQISQYTVNYGTTTGGPYPNIMNIYSVNGVIPTTVTVTGLTVGTWYFVVTATATNGMVSANSNEASKNIVTTSAPNPPTIRK
jgi:hypothetical protein